VLTSWKLPSIGLLALAVALAGCGGTKKHPATTAAPKKPAAPSVYTLSQATAGYKVYVKQEVGLLLAGVQKWATALEAGNLTEAKNLYGPVRYHYEAVEPVAESFGALDPEVDARDGDVPAAKWGGFHKIEQILWEKNTTAGTVPLVKALVGYVQTLDAKSSGLQFNAVDLANGAVELLDEVAKSKITGEEDRYSHTDLSDFQANLAGSRKAFQLLIPALKEDGASELVSYIDVRFAKVQADLDKYRSSSPLGFVLYNAVTAADRRVFAQDVDALAEPLSTVADKVNG
jgi:iron uptake system component EfeO